MKSDKISFAKYKPVNVQPSSLKNDKLLKDRINKASKSIRKKYLALKLGKADEDETLNRLLKPVIAPIKELTRVYTHEVGRNYISKKESKEQGGGEEEEESNRDDATSITSFKQYPPIVRQYIEGHITQRKEYDPTYGVKFDLQTKKLYMGNGELKIGGDSEIIIGDKTYSGSQGLYSLLFMKHPEDYSKKDLTDYKEILQITSAHKKNYDPWGQIVGTRSSKYTKIIKPLFNDKSERKDIPQTQSTTSGSGMNMVYNEKPIEYVFWDDVNELVERLKLLNASKLAGNTDSHDNEILAIINELREADVIE